MSGTIN